jgi:putative membrane protein
MGRRSRARSPLAASLAAGIAGALVSPAVLAHALAESRAAGQTLGWSFEPWVILPLLVSALGYAIGIASLWRRAGAGHGVRLRGASAFAAGWAALVVALLTPLDPLGSRLFSAHMVQHELLMLAAAPLLVLGRPLAVWAWALPQPWRRASGRFFHHPAWRLPWLLLTSPLVAWLLHALVLWLWHVPALFDAALDDPLVHTWQHLSFLLTALVFWWSVLGAVTRKEQGVALVSLFTTMVHTGALGALLTLARAPWYAHYVAIAPLFGLTALEDQQLGGVIMWVPAGAVYIVSGLALARRWIEPRPASRTAPGLEPR